MDILNRIANELKDILQLAKEIERLTDEPNISTENKKFS